MTKAQYNFFILKLLENGAWRLILSLVSCPLQQTEQYGRHKGPKSAAGILQNAPGKRRGFDPNVENIPEGKFFVKRGVAPFSNLPFTH
jgi:hypothetical protein